MDTLNSHFYPSPRYRQDLKKSFFGYFTSRIASIIQGYISTTDTTFWTDCVFDKTYKLRSLSQVAQYLKFNKPLSDVPSTTAVNQRRNRPCPNARSASKSVGQ